jgi:hypothetical protein
LDGLPGAHLRFGAFVVDRMRRPVKKEKDRSPRDMT